MNPNQLALFYSSCVGDEVKGEDAPIKDLFNNFDKDNDGFLT